MAESILDISFEFCLPVAEDAKYVMAWRNHPATLAVSYHQEPKIWESFWPEYRDSYFIADAGLNPVFACFEGSRIGFLKFCIVRHPESLPGLTVDISINLAPESRGKGLGPRVLRAALAHLKRNRRGLVYAEILAHNSASKNAFVAAGFRLLGEGTKFVADTGKTHGIVRLVSDLVSPQWRKSKVYVIAEAGSNWRMGSSKRDLAMARALIDVAVESHADAVKFQTYKPEFVYVANTGMAAIWQIRA